MSDRHRLLMAQNLLKEAARLYEKHEAGRPEPFNVFSVLRSESDEVNLHSRFLHALLNYRKPGENTRANLSDFLKHVGLTDFEQSNVRVERERHNIDILITNGAGQAVVIENKIEAWDQSEQLQRYYCKLKEHGYCKIQLLYLTLDSHRPSKKSVGALDPKHITCVSYENDFLDWLKRCRQRAYDKPALRESIAQYVQLVRKLTRTDSQEAYMKDLTELCLQDNNLVLVHYLNEAMFRARVCLLQNLWLEIECALKEEIRDLPPKDEDGKNYAHSVSDERTRLFLKPRSPEDRYHGLFFRIGSGVASLSVEANDERLFFGVRCHENHEDERKKLDDALRCVPSELPNDWWPRHQKDELNLKNPSPCELELLSNEADRKRHAKQIAQRLKPFWDAVKAAGLA